MKLMKFATDKIIKVLTFRIPGKSFRFTYTRTKKGKVIALLTKRIIIILTFK
jgi:hypothetical protein